MKQQTSTETTKLSNPFTQRDLDGTVDEDKAVLVSLNSENTTIKQDGVSMVDGDLVITKEGTYILEGTLKNGQIRIEADKTAKIQVVLNGVTITNQDGSALEIVQADKVFLTLGKDTKNVVTDGSVYNLAEGEDEPNAAIYSKADLTFNGEGTLVVNGNYKNGIVSKDDLKIASGTIQVKSVGDGIKGKDLVAIADGTITITTNGGSENSSKTPEGDEDPMWGKQSQSQQPPQMPSGQQGAPAGDKPQEPPTGQKENQSSDETKKNDSQTQETTTTQDGISAKGLKAEGKIYVSGGNIQLNTSDDSIHAGGNIVISNGSIQIASGDDGIHADDKLTIKGGDIQISKSYEGIEAADILVSGGTINVVSSDDGFNAAGGADGSSINQRQGQNGFGNVEDVSIVIQGGTILVNANGPLDYGSEAAVTGGSIIAGGSSGMAEGFTSSENQGSILTKLSSVVKANTEIMITDSDGKQVRSYTSPKDLSALIFSSSDITKGDTYTIQAGSLSIQVKAE